MSTNLLQARDSAWKEKERNRIMILLDDYANRTRELKASYNSLSTVASLPFEILAKIFDYYHSEEFYSRSFPWVHITVVCCRWRDVALKSPSLWCKVRLVDGIRPGFIQQFLDRSQGLLLTLTVDVYQSFPREALQTALLQSHRIEAMSISLRKVDYDSLDYDLLKLFQSLPSLKRLTLTKPALILDGGVDGSSTIPILCEDFDTSALRELVVTGYELREHSSLLAPHLTSLQFSESYFQKNGVTSPQDMLRVLSFLPNLHNLSLNQPHDRGVGPDTPISLNTPMELRRLRQLQLGGTITMFVSILSNLLFPASATLSVNLSDYPDEDELPSLAHCLVSHFSGTRRVGTIEPVRSCAFSVEYDGHNYPFIAILYLWKSNISYGHYHHDVSGGPPPAFKLRFDLSDVKPPMFIQDVFLRLPLGSVTSLSLSGSAIPILSKNPPVLSKLCAAMPNITSLNAQSRGIYSFTSYSFIQQYSVFLGQLPPQNGTPAGPTHRGASRRQPAQPVSRYGFSQLKTLRLEEIDFQPETTSPWIMRQLREPNGPTMLRTWVNVLQDRRRHGFPITTLLVRRCHWVGAEEVNLCRTAVKNVKWDRKFLAIDEEGKVIDRSDEIG